MTGMLRAIEVRVTPVENWLTIYRRRLVPELHVVFEMNLRLYTEIAILFVTDLFFKAPSGTQFGLLKHNPLGSLSLEDGPEQPPEIMKKIRTKIKTFGSGQKIFSHMMLQKHSGSFGRHYGGAPGRPAPHSTCRS